MERIKKIGWKIMWIRIGFIIFIITMILLVIFGYLTSDEESQFYIQPLPTTDPFHTPQPTPASPPTPIQTLSSPAITFTIHKDFDIDAIAEAILSLTTAKGCDSFIEIIDQRVKPAQIYKTDCSKPSGNP